MSKKGFDPIFLENTTIDKWINQDKDDNGRESE